MIYAKTRCFLYKIVPLEKPSESFVFLSIAYICLESAKLIAMFFYFLSVYLD